MAKTAYLNARIEPALKVKAEKILQAIGLNASDAIGLFYRQIIFRKGLPFDVCIPNATTIAALEELEAKGGTVHADDTQVIFDEIVAED